MINEKEYVDDGIPFRLEGAVLIGSDRPGPHNYNPGRHGKLDMYMEFKVFVFNKKKCGGGDKPLATKEGHRLWIETDPDGFLGEPDYVFTKNCKAAGFDNTEP